MDERKIEIETHGSCCRKFVVTVDENMNVTSMTHHGGCPGNLDAISKMIVHYRTGVREVVSMFKDMKCGSKQTSCMGQLAAGLERELPEVFMNNCSKSDVK